MVIFAKGVRMHIIIRIFETRAADCLLTDYEGSLFKIRLGFSDELKISF